MDSQSKSELFGYDEQLPDVSVIDTFRVEQNKDTNHLVIDWNKPIEDVKRPLERSGVERYLYTYLQLRNYTLGAFASGVALSGGPETAVPTAGVVMSAAWLNTRRARSSFQREMLAQESSRGAAIFKLARFRARNNKHDEQLQAQDFYERELRAGRVYESKPHRTLSIPAGETNFAGKASAEDFVTTSEQLYNLGLKSGITVHTRQELLDERSALMQAVDAYDSSVGSEAWGRRAKGIHKYDTKHRGMGNPARTIIDQWVQGDDNASRAKQKERQLRDVQSKLVELGSFNTLISFDLERLVNSIAKHPYSDDLFEASIGQLYSLTQFVTKQRSGDRLWAHTGDVSGVLLEELNELTDNLATSAYTISSND